MNSFAISQHRQAASLKKEADSVSTFHLRGGRNLPAQGYWSAGVWLRDGKDGLAGGRCMGVGGASANREEAAAWTLALPRTPKEIGLLLKDSGQSLNCSSVAPACW